MSLITNLRQQITEMRERNNRKRLSASEKKKLDELRQTLDNEVHKVEQKQRDEQSKEQGVWVSSIGSSTGPAKIDAGLKAASHT